MDKHKNGNNSEIVATAMHRGLGGSWILHLLVIRKGTHTMYSNSFLDYPSLEDVESTIEDKYQRSESSAIYSFPQFFK